MRWLAGAALAAVAIIPFVELLAHSIDVEKRGDFGPGHQPARYLLGVFLHDYWGRVTRSPLELLSLLQERAFYVGALTLMLAVVGLVLRPRWERLVLAGLGLAALAVATGLPPLFDVVTLLPGFSSSQNSRLVVVFVLCVALLAGWGLDELVGAAEVSRRRARLLLGICAGLVLLPLLVMVGGGSLALDQLRPALRVAWGFERLPAASLEGIGQLRELVRLASLLEWLLLAGAALALIALRLRGRLSAPALVTLAVALVALDLFKAGMGYNPAIPDDHAQQPTTAAIRYLQAQRPARFAGLDVTGAAGRASPLTPNVAMRYHLYDARGYDYPIEARYYRVWSRAIAGCLAYQGCPMSVTAKPSAFRALGLFGVTRLLQTPGDKPIPGLPVAYDRRDARIYTNPYALPRAFLVDHQTVVPDDKQALAAVTSPQFRPLATAITEKPLAGLAQTPARRRPPPGNARITSYQPERVAIQTNSSRDALLVLTDNHYPGWKATVDGKDTPIERVDYLLRGVHTPAGNHQIEFRYQPASWTAGWIISTLTLLALTATTLTAIRRQKRPPTTPTAT